jgi:hypothetical protein
MAAMFREAPTSAVVLWTPAATTRSGIRMDDAAILKGYSRGCSRDPG